MGPTLTSAKGIRIYMSAVNPFASYFAIQIKNKYETATQLARIVMMAAKDLKLTFDHLEALDTLEVGVNKFLRFRSDLPSASSLLNLIGVAGRGVIGSENEGFIVRIGGRRGVVSASQMHLIPRLPPVKFRGTSHKLWEAQFTKTDP